jgi:hypothetical protein
MGQNNNTSLVALESAKQSFAIALQDAQRLDIVNNVAGAFDAAIIVGKLESVLTDEVMDAVFMPLMNKKIGFKTDRDPSRPSKNNPHPTPYSRDVVRTCIIDAAANGLLPTGNQFNIISGTMYPTKEGYTALLAKLKTTMGLQYMFEFDPETTAKSADPGYVAIPCRISYKSTKKEDLKGWFKYIAMVKSNGETSTTDQLRGKAERKCKRAFYEFLTGIDLGDADASETVDVTYTEVSSKPQEPAKSAAEKAKEILAKRKNAERIMNEAAHEAGYVGQMEQPSGNVNLDTMSDEQIELFAKQHMSEEA